jgi:penicillin-binding protein 1A
LIKTSKKSASASKGPVLKPGRFRRVFKLLFILGIWAFIVVGCIVGWYAAELPHIVQDTSFQRKFSITVKAADGSVIARYGDLKGDSVAFKDLPPNLIHAVISIEDRRFYHHHGIDLLGLARATFVNLRSGEVVQGGSTLTQQLAKNLFLTQDRNFKRKIQEAMLALWLEHQLTKDEIITAYLNRVYMGSGAYGVEAASDVYFNKSAKNLTLGECAILAGLLKAPSRYSPLANPEESHARATVVLKAMLDEHYITQKQFNKVAWTKASLTPASVHKSAPEDTERYFTDYIMNQVVDLIGTPDRDIVVETTLWPQAQKAAERAVENELNTFGEKKNASQSAVVMMDTDGAVHVMVGGRDYNQSQFNRATQALRQPGSSFKPIVYLAALENGWHPNDMINDAPIAIGHYKPSNFKHEYFGEVPLHFALAHSLNSAAIQLIQNVGVGKVIAMAHNLGIRAPLEHNLSLALGSSGVPLLEMTTAYASIADGGIGVDPYAILKIEGTDGTLLYEHHDPAMPLQVASPQADQELATMMEETIDEGTGTRAQLPWRAAGKTGTSEDYRDAWFMGFSGRFVAGVWVGNDDNSSMKAVTGGSLPADIWKQVMLASYDEAHASDIPVEGAIHLGEQGSEPYNDNTPPVETSTPGPAMSPLPEAASEAPGPATASAGSLTPADAGAGPANDADQQYIGGDEAYVPPPGNNGPPQPDVPANDTGPADDTSGNATGPSRSTQTFGDVLHSLY